MNDPGSLNIYSPQDLSATPRVERAFISHRLADKPLARAVAGILQGQGLHYWFDEDDEDSRRAADLGIAGDEVLVYSIERGIRHCSRMLGLLSAQTRGSWWVPYEVGFSSAHGAVSSYLVLESIRRMEEIPGYARLAANYWSIDELVRWAASLKQGHVQAAAAPLDAASVAALERFVPRLPPKPDVPQLAARAIAAIERLFADRTQRLLRLQPPEDFSWLPTRGGLIRDLAYDLYAPLAFYQLSSSELDGPAKKLLGRVYQSVTWHYELAAIPPALAYSPEAYGWRQRRYESPASSWLQGLSADQLSERLRRFFIVPSIDRSPRLATKEEFKAEFDRILRSGGESERRSLGVLINPLFGFTPASRPVFARILALQYRLHSELTSLWPEALFDSSLASQLEQFLAARAT